MKLGPSDAMRCRQFSRALTMNFIGKEARRSDKNPAAPIAQEGEKERREPVPNDEDAEDHGLRRTT